MELKEVKHIKAVHNTKHACNQGSLVLLNNGDLLLGYNQERGLMHADSGQACFIKSYDYGCTLDNESIRIVWPYNDYQGNWDCSFSQNNDGTLLMHTRVCSFIKPSALNDNTPQSLGNYNSLDNYDLIPDEQQRLKRQTGYAIFKSIDYGETWEGPIPVNTSPINDYGLGDCSVGGSGAGHIIEMEDRSLLMPLEGTLTRDTNAQGGELGRCFLLKSNDGGNNWEYWSTVAFDDSRIKYFGEPGMVKLDSGKLICLMRCEIRPSRRFDNLWFSESFDNGASWSRPSRTELWGYPADIIQLYDGRVLAVYGYRKHPWGVRGCISNDGINWEKKDEFVIKKGGIINEDHYQYWHIGYPTVVQCDDNTIIVAYHEYIFDGNYNQCMWVSRFNMN